MKLLTRRYLVVLGRAIVSILVIVMNFSVFAQNVHPVVAVGNAVNATQKAIESDQAKKALAAAARAAVQAPVVDYQAVQVKNSIRSIELDNKNPNKIKLNLTSLPIGIEPSNSFTTLSGRDAQIVFDLPGVSNATGKRLYSLNQGDVRSIRMFAREQGTRLILTLKRSLPYTATMQGNALVLTLDNAASVSASQRSQPSGLSFSPDKTDSVAATAVHALRDIDFRRGVSGEGDVVIDLSHNNIMHDVRRNGESIVVIFSNTVLPESLRKILDVTDFTTPVRTISAEQYNKDVRLIIHMRGGQWEHTALQRGTQLLIHVMALRTEGAARGSAKKYRGEKMSLNFQNIDVRAVLQTIAEFTGINIIASDAVNGNITLRLQDVPWDQALDLVLQSKDLDKRQQGNVIWVAPREVILNKEKIELEQQALFADLEPLRTETFRLNYHKAEEFKSAFDLGTSSSAKQGILSKRGSLSVDTRTNQIFVTDISSVLDNIRNLIQKVDIPARQVLIEARMVEADKSFSRNLGAKVSFGASDVSFDGNRFHPGGAVALPVNKVGESDPGKIGFSLFNAASTRFINLELSALELEGNGKVISNPRVMAADAQKALIEQGTEIPYQEASSSGATSTSFKKANLKLEVTPQITPDGHVILTVDVTNDSPGQSVGDGGLAIDTKHVQTQVQVEDGGTVVIGGIYQENIRKSVTGVPGLRRIPYLGKLFETSSTENRVMEMLVFLTPRIMK